MYWNLLNIHHTVKSQQVQCGTYCFFIAFWHWVNQDLPSHWTQSVGAQGSMLIIFLSSYQWRLLSSFQLCCFVSSALQIISIISMLLSFWMTSQTRLPKMKTKKANPAAPSPSLLLLFIIILSVIELSTGDPRSRIIQIMCEKQLEHDLTIFVHNFVLMMKNISDQMRTSGFGVAISGSGPDTNYGLVQCYGDLSVLDCVLCYAETRTVLPRCFPFTGGRIYLDGCFMQAQNCSLIEEYTGPSDYASCGNETERTPRSRSLRGRL